MIRIDLPKPPSVNALYANVQGRGRVKTAVYKSWLRAAGWQLLSQRPPKVTGRVKLKYLIEDIGRVDLPNHEKALTDFLVSQRIIEDDNRSIVRGVYLDWSTEVAGCRVIITPEAV